MHLSISRFKRVVFSFAATLILLVGAEAVVRTRYFFLHHHDWNYITMPFRVHDTQSMDHAFYIAPTRSQPSGTASGAVSAGSPGSTSASSDQMNFTWLRPCRDREVFSEHYHKPMPYTWDANCFRGDPVSPAKPPGEIRLFVLGGSTVEDAQPDVDMWTAQLKAQLGDPRVKVVNAGQTAMGSASVAALYDQKIRLFAPDVVLYYEAWNEQAQFWQGPRVDERVGALTNRLHRALHYRSAVYTYLVEKYAFMMTKDVRFWKIDVGRLNQSLERLSRTVRQSGARLVFVTQAIRFPRHWKGVDTFDPRAVDALLDRLKRDPSYAYDTEEVSALNQRLAVFRSIEMCGTLNVPVINILDEVEALGDGGRQPLFLDLGHLTWQGDHLVGTLVGKKLVTMTIR